MKSNKIFIFLFRQVYFLVFFLSGCINATEPYIKETFTHIYDNGVWGRNSSGEPLSGKGSLIENAAEYVFFLNRFIKLNNIRSIVDVGCGDWEIMRHVNLDEIDCVAIDIVDSVIKRNQKKFGSKNISFVCEDFINGSLPVADLLICKDVLIHFPDKYIFALINQLKKYKHILITTSVDEKLTSSNKDIPLPGGFRTLDLIKPPFNLTAQKVLVYSQDLNFDYFKAVFYIRN